MIATCRTCGDFEFDHDESKNITFINCPKCHDELGAFFKDNSPEGIEYKKRFITLKEYEI